VRPSVSRCPGPDEARAGGLADFDPRVARPSSAGAYAISGPSLESRRHATVDSVEAEVRSRRFLGREANLGRLVEKMWPTASTHNDGAGLCIGVKPARPPRPACGCGDGRRGPPDEEFVRGRDISTISATCSCLTDTEAPGEHRVMTRRLAGLSEGVGSTTLDL